MDDRQDSGTAHARGSGGRFVYDELKREILSLTLAPGTPLDETSLAQRFGLSRSPIREALVRLSAEGLVETLSNRTTLVAPVDLAGFPRYIEALDILQRVNTRLAARHREDSDLERMTHFARAFDAACAAQDDLEMSAANRDFHMAVAEAGRNPYTARPYGQLLDDGRRVLHMHFDFIRATPNAVILNRDHHDMIAAIEARDVERADALAHAHTRKFHDRFVDFLRPRYEEDFDPERSFEDVSA